MPQFYLNYFTNPQKKLETFDLARRKRVKACFPEGVCCGEFFYSPNAEADDISQAFEEHFRGIENSFSIKYKDICSQLVGRSGISVGVKLNISEFAAMLFSRGPYMRVQIKRMNESFIKQIMRLKFGGLNGKDRVSHALLDMGKEISEEKVSDIVSKFDSMEYSVDINSAAHLRMLAEWDRFVNFFFNKEWVVYIIKSDKEFLTSDNPVYEEFPDWTGKFFYGPTIMQRTHYIALTPKILIEMRDCLGASESKRPEERFRKIILSTSEEDKDMVDELNLKRANNGTKFMYGQSTTAFSALDRHVEESRSVYTKILQGIITNVAQGFV